MGKVIEWVVVIFLWIVAAAFTISDLLCVLALFHNRKDREFLLVIGTVVIVFAMFAACAVYGALRVGRCLV